MSKVEGNRPKTGGRKKGTPNKTTALLKDAILKAAEAAGHGDLVEYLRQRAIDTPGPFMGLLGKVLPMQIQGGDPDKPITHSIEVVFKAPQQK